jgi:hypothetical protein
VLGAQKHAGEIDSDDPVPICKIKRMRRRFMSNTRNIGKDIDSAKLFFGHRDCSLNVRFQAHVRALKDALPACRLDLLCRLTAGFYVDIGRNDFGPLLCEQQRNAFSDSHTGTRYECYPVFETHYAVLSLQFRCTAARIIPEVATGRFERLTN